MDKLRERIKGYIIENFLFGDDEGLDDQTSFLKDGIIDSTGVLELVNFLDDEFNIRILDDEILPEDLDSINNIVRFLDKRGGPKIWDNDVNLGSPKKEEDDQQTEMQTILPRV